MKPQEGRRRAEPELSARQRDAHSAHTRGDQQRNLGVGPVATHGFHDAPQLRRIEVRQLVARADPQSGLAGAKDQPALGLARADPGGGHPVDLRCKKPPPHQGARLGQGVAVQGAALHVLGGALALDDLLKAAAFGLSR
jgi:hypothetical protein